MNSTNNGLMFYLTDESNLQQIEELSNNLISAKDIAQILQVEEKVFLDELKKENSAVYKAFYTGFLKREIEIRQKCIVPADVDESEFTLKQIADFKSTLTIQLHG